MKQFKNRMVAKTILDTVVSNGLRIATRDESSKKQLLANIKVLCNAMIENGDADITTWNSIRLMVEKTPFQKFNDLQSEIKSDTLLSSMTNLADMLKLSFSVESIDSSPVKDPQVKQLLTLALARKEIDQKIDKLVASMDMSDFDKTVSEMVNKYKSLLPKSVTSIFEGTFK